MQAVEVAQKRWARRRLGEPAGSSMPGWNTARITTILLLVLAVAVIGLAAIGLTVIQREDGRRAIARHAALQELLLDELHAVFGDVDHFDAGQLRLIERRTGLVDLHFDADLTADGDLARCSRCKTRAGALSAGSVGRPTGRCRMR